MPVLFVGHGSPMNVLDKENLFNQNFSLITQKFAKPKAILMISAHWYSSRLQVTSGEHPEMIYDFYGFPEELSQMYSGLNLNQDKATKPQIVQIVRQGNAVLV